MPSPYSYDLRQKVIKAIDGGMSRTQVSSIFGSPVYVVISQYK